MMIHCLDEEPMKRATINEIRRTIRNLNYGKYVLLGGSYLKSISLNQIYHYND